MNKTARNRLRVCRAERRLTQLETAKRARIGSDRYWRIENGWTEATDEEITRLARVLRTTPELMFPGVAA